MALIGRATRVTRKVRKKGDYPIGPSTGHHGQNDPKLETEELTTGSRKMSVRPSFLLLGTPAGDGQRT